MSLLLSAASRRRATVSEPFPLPPSVASAPWNAQPVPNTVIPTYDGSGNTVHPSVVDTGKLWNGYRWWLADTPYPNGDAALENPSVYGSNDRLTWHVPEGLTNPIRGYPGSGYHSDTEMVYDADNDRLVCFYRYTESGTLATSLYAQASSNGSEWTPPSVVIPPSEDDYVSLTIEQTAEGKWRLYSHRQSASHRVYEADDLFGPWTYVGSTTLIGRSGWHGSIVRHAGQWWSIYSDSNNPPGAVYARTSLDGMEWSSPALIMSGTDGGWATQTYRPTITPSTEANCFDCWFSGRGDVPGKWRVNYVRLPLSLWPVAPLLP